MKTFSDTDCDLYLLYARDKDNGDYLINLYLFKGLIKSYEKKLMFLSGVMVHIINYCDNGRTIFDMQQDNFQ
jgi:hypothetical protein